MSNHTECKTEAKQEQEKIKHQSNYTLKATGKYPRISSYLKSKIKKQKKKREGGRKREREKERERKRERERERERGRAREASRARYQLSSLSRNPQDAQYRLVDKNSTMF